MSRLPEIVNAKETGLCDGPQPEKSPLTNLDRRPGMTYSPNLPDAGSYSRRIRGRLVETP